MAQSGNSFKVVSMNVRGLRNARKRRILFHNFKKEKYDIICLQETYLTKDDVSLIEKEWSSGFHMAEGSNKSKGLLTLFSKKVTNLPLSLVFVNERCLISFFSIDDLKFSVVNIYAPCTLSEKVKFLKNVQDFITDSSSDNDSGHMIVAGDFNTVLNNSLDIISGINHCSKTVDLFNTLVNNLLLTDIWRVTHPNRKEFTWSKNNPFIARRIDYLLISESLIPFCKDSDIKFYGFSDHKATTLNIDFSSFKRGPSVYKFNVSLLKNVQYINEVTNEILRIKSIGLDPHLCWEYVKVIIKDIAMKYGRSLARDKRNKKYFLTNKINELEKSLSLNPSDLNSLKAYTDAKCQLELLIASEAEGARIRSGQKWALEGEKCSKFFLSLEKQRSNSNTLFKIENQSCPQGYTSDPIEILDTIQSYFKNVYSIPTNRGFSDTQDEIFTDPGGTDVLDLNDKLFLDKALTVEELLQALKLSNNNSAPGLDGLPVEVYKVFWKDIKDLLLASFNFSFQVGHLTLSQSTGMICLHHKGKGQPREKISNWRPISLTNADYKLIAKVLALRMNSCLSKCISPDQYAFIKGRQIADLLREMDDVVEYGKTFFPNSIMLSVDYAKAFDTLSLSAIKKTLLHFGFGNVFCKWIDVILSNRKCCVRNGGYISGLFDMDRGVRQGCPISPLLFILTIELLAIDIRKNDKIKGLKLPSSFTPLKVKMYADDATFFLKDLIDYREVLSRIKLFSNFSGLCLNKNKSSAMYFGDSTQKNQFKYGIRLVNSVKILGVTFSNETAASDNDINFQPKIEQLERICSLWEKRYLTIIGKITVLKSFGLPIFVYLMQSIGINDNYF